MSEEYLHACQRAELLGEPTPSEQEWLASKKCDVDDEINEADDGVIEGLEQSDDSMKRVGGGLDELHSILNVTQKEINRLKTVCGSIGKLLRGKMTSRSSTPDPNHKDPDGNDAKPSEQPCDDTTTLETTNNSVDPVQDQNIDESKIISSAKKHEINHKIGSQIDKLDSLITKAENAQYSMQHQTKQMKKIIKK